MLKSKHFKAFHAIKSHNAPYTPDDRYGSAAAWAACDHPTPLCPGRSLPSFAYSLWVSQSTQWEFPRMFRIDCKAMASLWLVSRDWARRETYKRKP